MGYKNVVEDIITLTDIKTPSDFRPSSSPGQTDSQQGRHVDFFFELPTHTSCTNGTLRPLPLSGTVSGTTNLTQTTALNDHKVIQGECEVTYWIEAQFRLAGKKVGFLNHDVHISALYPRLRVSVSKGFPHTLRAKPDMLARCRFQKCPKLSVNLSESDMAVESDSNPRKRRISIPMTLALDTSSTAPIDCRQSLKCSVEAKWEVKSHFSTVPVRSSADRPHISQAVYKTTTASTQKAIILFRPLPRYEDRDAPNAKTAPPSDYFATSRLDLSVPDALSQPSLRWDYLSRAYMLNLTLNFDSIQGAPKYSIRSNIPLSVSSYGSKADDAQESQIVVDVTEAAAFDLDVDDADDSLAVLGTDQTREQAPIQRTVPRTPPPPYIR